MPLSDMTPMTADEIRTWIERADRQPLTDYHHLTQRILATLLALVEKE